MTSLAIVFATLPTAAALGRGAGFRQPLGITVVGGVIVSTFLTLLVIPSVYLLFDNFALWLGRIFHPRHNLGDDNPTGGGTGRQNRLNGANGHQNGPINGQTSGQNREISLPVRERETEALD